MPNPATQSEGALRNGTEGTGEETGWSESAVQNVLYGLQSSGCAGSQDLPLLSLLHINSPGWYNSLELQTV